MKKSKAFYPCCDTFGGICHVSSFYPYMYFDTIRKKIQGLVFQFPFVGSGIALVLCWSSLNQYTSGKELDYYLYGNWKGGRGAIFCFKKRLWQYFCRRYPKTLHQTQYFRFGILYHP